MNVDYFKVNFFILDFYNKHTNTIYMKEIEIKLLLLIHQKLANYKFLMNKQKNTAEKCSAELFELFI